MEKEADQEKKCLQCGKGLTDGEGSAQPLSLYCEACLLQQAEERIEKEQAALSPPRRRRQGKAWTAFLLLILLASLVAIAVMAPRLIATFEAPKPIRAGSYATDALTDRCLGNLWQAVALLQQGKRPGADLVCPAGGQPYVVVQEREDTLVKCPDPSRHGFREIQASRKKPVPELRK